MTGPAPFTFSIGKAQNVLCDNPPCEAVAAYGKHLLTADKAGYFQKTSNVEIKRGKTVSVEVKFTFVPKITEIGEFSLPDKLKNIENNFYGINVPDGTLKMLEKIPSKSKKISFGNDPRFALVHLGKEIYLAGAKGGEAFLLQSRFKPEGGAAFAGDSVVAIEPDDSGSRQLVLLYPIADAEPSQVTVFNRPLQNPKVIISPGGKNILITEEKDNIYSAYLINLDKKSKNKLSLPDIFSDVRFADETHLLYSMTILEEDSTREQYVLFDVEKNTHTSLPLLSMRAMVPFENSFIILSAENLAKKGDASNTSFKDIIDKTLSGNALELPNEKTVHIEIWEADKGEFGELASFELAQGEEVSRLEMDVEHNRVMFVKKDVLLSQNGNCLAEPRNAGPCLGEKTYALAMGE